MLAVAAVGAAPNMLPAACAWVEGSASCSTAGQLVSYDAIVPERDCQSAWQGMAALFTCALPSARIRHRPSIAARHTGHNGILLVPIH
jgi:hypothetical protein